MIGDESPQIPQFAEPLNPVTEAGEERPLPHSQPPSAAVIWLGTPSEGATLSPSPFSAKMREEPLLYKTPVCAGAQARAKALLPMAPPTPLCLLRPHQLQDHTKPLAGLGLLRQSHSITQTSLKLTTGLLPQPPECCD